MISSNNPKNLGWGRNVCVLLLLTPLFASAQFRYPAKMTFRVVDDGGNPVQMMEIRTSTFSDWEKGEGFGRSINDLASAKTDENGIATVETRSLRGAFAYGPGDDRRYYRINSLRYQFKEVVNGRWEPWNPQLEIVVPRILNPLPLYVRRMDPTELPSTGPVGFDLLVSDWLAPFGKGVRADFVFETKTKVPMVDPAKAFDSSLTISFSNLGDGIQSQLSLPPRRLVELPRQAPLQGYSSVESKRVARAAEGASMEKTFREDQNFFFRVRTVWDADGKVISALYGKIYGDIVWDTLNSPKGHIRFTYYLNPTPLDRNLEFDPKRNLFPDTLHGTNVSEP